MKSARTAPKAEVTEQETLNLHDEIQLLAYAKWFAETSGQPVSQQETERYWLEAEAETLNRKSEI